MAGVNHCVGRPDRFGRSADVRIRKLERDEAVITAAPPSRYPGRCYPHHAKTGFLHTRSSGGYRNTRRSLYPCFGPARYHCAASSGAFHLTRFTGVCTRAHFWRVVAPLRTPTGSGLVVFPCQTALGQQGALICRIVHLGSGRVSRTDEYQRCNGRRLHQSLRPSP